MAKTDANYVHALRFSKLTALYDPVVALTTRERVFKNALLSAASLAQGLTVLDVGCGTGTLAIRAKQREPLLCVHGIDGDPEILRRALKKAESAGVAVQFTTAMSFELPYPKGSFDRVVSSLFFHHLTAQNKRRTFLEIYRVTKPGGELHVADWGVPQNIFMRLLYFGIQLLDGFQTTGDNIRGLLPQLMQQIGFADVRVVKEVSTMLGTIAIYSGTKSALK